MVLYASSHLVALFCVDAVEGLPDGSLSFPRVLRPVPADAAKFWRLATMDDHDDVLLALH